MLGKAALEFRGSDSAVAEIVDAGITQLEDSILKIILNGQGNGEIPKERILMLWLAISQQAFMAFKFWVAPSPVGNTWKKSPTQRYL